MAQIACWNGKIWEVSLKAIKTMDALSTSYSLESKSNADKEGESPTETMGMALQQISFTTTYSVETGTPDIRGEIESWKGLISKAAPLIIGENAFGADKFQLQQVNVSDLLINDIGQMRSAKLQFTFKEFAEEASACKTSAVIATENSALGITADAKDKESKKTKTI